MDDPIHKDHDWKLFDCPSLRKRQNIMASVRKEICLTGIFLQECPCYHLRLTIWQVNIMIIYTIINRTFFLTKKKGKFQIYPPSWSTLESI